MYHEQYTQGINDGIERSLNYVFAEDKKLFMAVLVFLTGFVFGLFF